MEVDSEITEFIHTSPQRTIFCYPWWLKAVAGDSFEYVVLETNGGIEAVMPIVRKRKWGFKLCTMPPYSQSLGILLPPMEGKYVTNLSNQHKIMEALIERLPRSHYYNIRFHASLQNWLPFYWNGFFQTTRYTYVYQSLENLDAIWESMRSNIRREIRKAEKILKVHSDKDIEKLIHLRNQTYNRQDKKPIYGESIIRRLYQVCDKRQKCKLFFAKDEQQRTHSGVLLVWDDRTAYYLIGGSDPELRTSGAASLVMWAAIQYASRVVSQFNFEGSMVQSIERFFRAFGGRQMPYHSLTKYCPKFLGIRELL